MQIMADMAAGLAAASYALETSGSADTGAYQRMAVTLYSVAKQNEADNTRYELQPESNVIPTPDDSNQNSFQMVNAYLSGTQYDDMLWAAAWLATAVD